MKRFAIIALVCLVLICTSSWYYANLPTPPQGIQPNDIVYRGETGTKYHYQDCPTLKGKGSPITYDEALEQGREPCKVCR